MSLKQKRKEILEFQEAYKSYLAILAATNGDFPTEEEEHQLEDLRSKINRAVPIVISFINQVGEPTTVHYAPPPAVGGLAGQIDLLQNIFNPTLSDIRQHVLDLLDRSLGRYDYLIRYRWRNWINPLYWIGQVIRFPFKLVAFAGFDATKVEFSFFGKIYKFLAGLFAFVVSVLEIYKFAKSILEG